MVPKLATRPELCEAPSAIACVALSASRPRSDAQAAAAAIAPKMPVGCHPSGGADPDHGRRVPPTLRSRRHRRWPSARRSRPKPPPRPESREPSRARMTTQGNIVVVERVRSGAVDPGGLGRGHAWARKIEAGLAGGGASALCKRRGGASMLPAISVPTQSAKPVWTTPSAPGGMLSSLMLATKRPRDVVSD